MSARRTSTKDLWPLSKTPYSAPVACPTIDLRQVDLMNFRVEFVRPRSGRASDGLREVDLSRLKGFRFRFAPKMRSGVITFVSAEIL